MDPHCEQELFNIKSVDKKFVLTGFGPCFLLSQPFEPQHWLPKRTVTVSGPAATAHAAAHTAASTHSMSRCEGENGSKMQNPLA